MKKTILVLIAVSCLLIVSCSVEKSISYGDDALGDDEIIDLTNCISYYDGCNTCGVVDGKISGCTEIGCDGGDYSKGAKCLEYKAGSEDWITMVVEASNCTEYGTLSEDSIMYNENSKTYWINLDPFENPYNCNPACVVYENGTTEINWRCTGLI